MTDTSRASITLIGGGRMGSAMAAGWLAGPSQPHLTIVTPRPSDRIQAWADTRQIVLNPAPAQVDVLVIAVKPQVYPSIMADLTAWIGADTLVISVMAGLTSSQLQADLGTSNVVRVMPNTPGAVGKGVSLLSVGHGAVTGAFDMAAELCAPLGAVEGPLDEALMSAATAISGCGPAYLFLLAEAMADAGKAAGIEPAMAARLANATVEGAAALLAASDEAPSDLRRGVTSPNGVTQAALEVLMGQGGLPDRMKDAVQAAITRDRELSAPKT